MRADELINDLMAIHPKGFDLSLGRITALLGKLGNPQNKIPPAIHVAGTNGKGSTVAFCRALLEANGKTVHVHTSPHLVNWHERYRLCGQLVSDAVFSDAIERVAKANDGQKITVFEILSAVMFVLFSEREADYCIVEVGLGGRFDATNVISNPVCSLIAPVALDHKAFLGDTIEKIAFEKAGIIKKSCPVIVGRQTDAARSVIESRADELGCQSYFARQDFDFEQEHGRFVYQDTNGLLDLPVPNLIGEHQMENASLALAALRYSDIQIDEKSAEVAMQQVSWPGRMQKLEAGIIPEKFGNDTQIWLDGGHNPHAGIAVAKVLETKMNNHHRATMIVGMLDTKEPEGYFNAFKQQVDQVITVPITSSDQGIPPQELAAIAKICGFETIAKDSLSEAIEFCVGQGKKRSRQTIMFAGSLYLVGDVLELNQTPPV